MYEDFEEQPDLKEHLLSGEKLLWSGRPSGGLKLRKSDAVTIPFSLIWAAFAIFWETTAILSKAPFFFWLWGIPFVLVGLYIVFGRFLFDAWLRARTVYGVTNQRVLSYCGRSGALTSLPLLTLSKITVTEHQDGTGTISFGEEDPAASSRSRTGYPPREGSALEFIPDVRYVSSIIHAAQMKLRPNAE
jgi:hypothetical protein